MFSALTGKLVVVEMWWLDTNSKIKWKHEKKHNYVKNICWKKTRRFDLGLNSGLFKRVLCSIRNTWRLYQLHRPGWTMKQVYLPYLCSVGLYFSTLYFSQFLLLFLIALSSSFFQFDYSTITGYLLLCLTLDFIVVVVSFSFRLPTQPKRFNIWTQINLVGTMGKCNTIA
jgi:hypothetical protein